jgi:predicted house-cleaning noncanonical NTP pyrophosphatase (MazG superfamily)
LDFRQGYVVDLASNMNKKLIRDNIPTIIRDKGEICTIEHVNGSEYLSYLYTKLNEEKNELIADETPEEMADVFEVLEAIAQFKGWNLEEIYRIKSDKKNQKGGFENGVVLVS